MNSEEGKMLNTEELAFVDDIFLKLKGSAQEGLIDKMQEAVRLYQDAHVPRDACEVVPSTPNLNGDQAVKSNESRDAVVWETISAEPAETGVNLGKRAGQEPPAFVEVRTDCKRNRSELESSSAATELSSMKRQRVLSAVPSHNIAERMRHSSHSLSPAVSTSEVTKGAETQRMSSAAESLHVPWSDCREQLNLQRERKQDCSVLSTSDSMNEGMTTSGTRNARKPNFDEIGGTDNNFFAHVRALWRYRAKHAHVVVASHAPRLRRWCWLVRGAQEKGILPASRKHALDELGFEWDISAVRCFTKFLNKLRRFEEEFALGKARPKRSSWFESELRLVESGKASAERCPVLEDSESFQTHLRETEMLLELERSNKPPAGTRVLPSTEKNSFFTKEALIDQSQGSTGRADEVVTPFENLLPTIDDGVDPLPPLLDIPPVWTGRRWIPVLPRRIRV